MFYCSPYFLKITDDEGYSGECEFPGLCLDILKAIFLPILLTSSKMTYDMLYHRLYWGIRNEGFRGGAAMALGHLDRIFYDLDSPEALDEVFFQLFDKDQVEEELINCLYKLKEQRKA